MTTFKPGDLVLRRGFSGKFEVWAVTGGDDSRVNLARSAGGWLTYAHIWAPDELIRIEPLTTLEKATFEREMEVFKRAASARRKGIRYTISFGVDTHPEPRHNV